MLLWDDNPSAVDLLGFDAISDAVSEALVRPQLDPVCVGVFGPWGSGKTTVLNLIAERLSRDESVIVVYTQPWSYDPANRP
jgi:predicted KAP-like P-loop ATPase